MAASDNPDLVPNPYAERPLDDDSAGALAALLFETPSNGTEHGSAGVDDQAEPNGQSTLHRQVSSTPVEGPPPAIDRSVVEATGTLFAPIDDADDFTGPRSGPAGRGPLFNDAPVGDPDQPASLRWSTVVHEPTVADMGASETANGRRLFLDDAAPVVSPPRLVTPPPDRFGGPSLLGDVLDRRWQWFAVVGVTSLLVGAIVFAVSRGGSGGSNFPTVSVESADEDGESVVDTVPSGPGLASNDEGNTGSFKDSSTSTSTSATVARRPAVVTTDPSTSTSSTIDSSTTSTSTSSSTTSTSLTTTTEATTTSTTASTTTTTPTTTATTTPTTGSTTTDPTTTTTGSTTTDPTTTTTGSTTTDPTTTTTGSTTTDPDSTTTTDPNATTTTDGPGPAQSTSSSGSTTTVVDPDDDGVIVVSDDPPGPSATTIF